MGEVRERLGESLQAFKGVFRNPNLRRLELAGAGSIIGQWAYSVALAVFAFRSGGAGAVGLVALIRMLPSAFAAPFASMLGDRYRRELVMVLADLTRVATIGSAAGAVFAGAPAGVVYALAGVTSILTTAFQPAQSALLPSLARTPEELTAANVVASTIDSVGIFAGPALGGVLLATTSTGVVFLTCAGTFLWSALNVVRIDSSGDRIRAAVERSGLKREALAGFRAIALEKKLRLLVVLYAAQTLVAGALTVLVVVIALDLLKKGNSSVGVLNAAMGVGGLAGAIVAFALVGRRRLAADFGLGILLWGFPLVVLGIWPSTALALAMLGVIGLGNTIVDVAGLTLLQRAAPAEVLTRVFGVLESMLLGTIGLGAILAPLLISGLGIRGALIATGSFLPVLAALFWRRLVEIDAASRVPAAELELLGSVPIFAPLPGHTLERLASQLVRVAEPAGTEVIRQGDRGDRFYVIAEAELDVAVDGNAVAELGPGGYFGEIALLRDVPRTATVTARTPVVLYALERESFLGAVTGHAPSARAADAVVGARLGAPAPGSA